MRPLPWLILTVVLLNSARAQGSKSPAPGASMPVSIDKNGIGSVRAGAKGRVLLLNFWATWCQPCVEEFPDLVRLGKAYKEQGFDIAFVSIDDTDARTKLKVMQFLKKAGVSSGAFIKEKGDDEGFINAVHPQWTGALPATFIYNRRGELVKMKVEESTYSELERIITPLLKQ